MLPCCKLSLLLVALLGATALGPNCSVLAEAEDDFRDEATPWLQQFCFDCHGKELHEAEVNLESLASGPSFATDFRVWRKVSQLLAAGKMPPAEAPQPNDVQRQQLITAVRQQLQRTAAQHADDPGPVTLRRLTGAEYAYTLRDLTGLDLHLHEDFVGDAVGGEGFANVGDVQFMQDSTLERYLGAAKRAAAHAVIGAGPLAFHEDPGQTGFELSAITRIQRIYRAHGFRTAAGEGGEAFGLDRYRRAFYTAWQFRHRQALGRGEVTLAELAVAEGIDTRFAETIWSVVNNRALSFPTAEIAQRWDQLPPPVVGVVELDANEEFFKSIRAQCEQIHQVMYDWQLRFGQNADAKEEAPVLAVDSFDVNRSKLFEMNINWPPGTTVAHLQLRVESANRDGTPNAVVSWLGPAIQFRDPDRRLRDPQPLARLVTAPDARRLNFGRHPSGGSIAADDFVTSGTQPPAFELPIPAGTTSARFTVTAQLDVEHGDDCIVRCTIAQEEETDQGKQVSALLANPQSSTYRQWKAGVLEFARLLPQVSHREPAPSDRDPIPPPFDNSYNNPERNDYHYKIKYHRDDAFLVNHILDDATRRELNDAWTDLLGSFEYHDAYLRFVAKKYQIELAGRGIADLDAAWVDALPPAPRAYIQQLRRDYLAIQTAFATAAPGQLDDALQFAGRAWRRPLVDAEQQRLRRYYLNLRDEGKLDHRQALRALLTRILLAPEFLYRAERPQLAATSAAAPEQTVALSDWELASRLSYFLWSSLPDDQLRDAAAAGELRQPARLAAEAKRMLADPKARRLATEFFGQWFGFYQFDRYRGIDPQRFPEFTDSLKESLHNEAVSFFEYVIRQDRPVREILFADYAFLNDELAGHYGVDSEQVSTEHGLVPQVGEHRGGLLGLGAVLAVTSAPRRTSPVKRGDWILRRVLGTPVPPPPADAGSIAADDVVADGLSVRTRLAAHRREASCQNCHSRIDPLGFALENYDPLGRWRENYPDGQAIEVTGTLQDGSVIQGVTGLREYLRDHERLFQRTLCTKLVGYAFGRRESISDVQLIDGLTDAIEQDGRISTLVERIVQSRQFRYRRSGGDEPLEARKRNE